MSLLRKNTLLVSIKPHSTLQKFFRGTDLKADLNNYAEVLDYINSIHPDFIVYLKKQAENEVQETFVFLDKDFRELTQEEMFMRKPKKDDIIYIVPAIVGGGGKRGIFAILAVAALMIAAPYLIPSLGTTALWGTGASTVFASSVVTTIGINLALMGITMLLAPKAPKSETSRDNDAFGSLVNSTASGTPVPLNYGLVRVAGQLLSGYTKTVEAAAGEDITLSSITVAS